MTATNVTSQQAVRCLEILQKADGPLVAADLAAMLYLSGSRETQRRQIRAIVQELREGGSMIVATLQNGYWLTNDYQLWRDYLDGRQIDAKQILAETHRRKKAALVQDQGILFDGKARV